MNFHFNLTNPKSLSWQTSRSHSNCTLDQASPSPNEESWLPQQKSGTPLLAAPVARLSGPTDRRSNGGSSPFTAEGGLEPLLQLVSVELSHLFTALQQRVG